MGIRSLIQIIILTFTLNLYAELGNESFDLKNYRAGGMTDGGSCGVITPEGDLRLKDYMLFDQTQPNSHRPGDIIESHKYLDVVELDAYSRVKDIKTLPSYIYALETFEAWHEKYPLEVKILKKQLEKINFYGANYKFGNGTSNCTKQSEVIIALYAKSPIEEFTDSVFISVKNFNQLSFEEQAGVFIKETFRSLQFKTNSPLKVENLENNLSEIVSSIMFSDPKTQDLMFDKVIHNGHPAGSDFQFYYKLDKDLKRAKKVCLKFFNAVTCEFNDDLKSNLDNLANYPVYRYNLSNREFYLAFAHTNSQVADFYMNLLSKEGLSATAKDMLFRQIHNFLGSSIALNERRIAYSLNQASMNAKKLKQIMYPELLLRSLSKCQEQVSTFSSCLPFVISFTSGRLDLKSKFSQYRYNKELREVFATYIVD